MKKKPPIRNFPARRLRYLAPELYGEIVSAVDIHLRPVYASYIIAGGPMHDGPELAEAKKQFEAAWWERLEEIKRALGCSPED